MKKLLLSLALILPVMLIKGQYNLPEAKNRDYCSHIIAGEERAGYYDAPQWVDPLLEEYDVTFYFLDLNVESDTTFLSGNVTIRARSTVAALDTFAFELDTAMNIDSVLIDGIQHTFHHESDLARVPLNVPILLGNMISAKIYYHGTPQPGQYNSGVFSSFSSTYQKNVTWSLSEPYAAKAWWPTKQDLTDKADSVWVYLTTNPGNKAGSEGLLKGITAMPDGKFRYEWKCGYSIDYYLISFAVADYQDYRLYAHPGGTTDSVLIQNYIYNTPACLSDNKATIDGTAALIELFSGLFGPYPFIREKYGHCLTQLAGGMEHQTMTTLGSFNFELIAHELGHMWFGDKVTCATWSDIWINEGFATYSDYLAHHFLTTPFYDSVWLKTVNDKVKAEPGGSVYVPAEELGIVSRIFDERLTYQKGALILHMIRFELQDDELFFHVLQTYVEQYGDSVATGDNFRDWLEGLSGKDFTDFFSQWYYGEGYPVFDIVWQQGNDTLTIVSTQTASTNVTTLFKMLVPYRLVFKDGTDTNLLLRQDANLDTYKIPVNKATDYIEFDPDQWILHRLNSISLGLAELENPVYFTLGPNPAKGYVRVFLSLSSEQYLKLSVSDLTGRILMAETIKNTDDVINISHLSAGVYLVTISDGFNMMNKKLMVQ